MARARSYIYLCVTLAAVSTSLMVLVKYNSVSTYISDSSNVGDYRIAQNVQGNSRYGQLNVPPKLYRNSDSL